MTATSCPGLSRRPEATMIVVAPAGGWAARSNRSTPPVSATASATAPILAASTPLLVDARRVEQAEYRERRHRRDDRDEVADDRVARARDLGHRRLEEEEGGRAEAREEQRLVEGPGRGAAEPDHEQRAGERVDRVAAVAPVLVQPALEPVGAGTPTSEPWRKRTRTEESAYSAIVSSCSSASRTEESAYSRIFSSSMALTLLCHTTDPGHTKPRAGTGPRPGFS